ncbi:MAG TPA: hypothetical protein H9671_07980 [Firmicutes bacterium]|nr:hypothetical protein [Bacillota bacterium]
MKKKLFGSRITPACTYCRHGNLGKDGKYVLCERNGIVDAYYHCRKFSYSPLKRVPKPLPPLPQYTKDDFSL